MDIVAVTDDSRKVVLGSLFVAIPGTKADGGAYIADAIARGAVAVIAGISAPVPDMPGVRIVRVEDPRQVLANVAARFYRHQPGIVLAVTGTSGKTSVAEFTRQILTECGRAAASAGTIGVIKPSGAVYGSLTTPDPVTLHATLADLADEGVTHLAMEASSHGLDQHRLDGVKLTAGAFTNLGRDHLDYHPTIEAYLAAKLRLFSELLHSGQRAVVNSDGDRAADVMRACKSRGLDIFTVGRTGTGLRLDRVAMDGFAQVLDITTAGGLAKSVRLPLVGAYQVENALVAAGLAIAAGEDAGRVIAALAALKGVKGRLEIIGEARGGLGVVDYAHKPEALTAALGACRPFVTGKLICVFGCGGDRDRGKRLIMGEIAVAKSDVVIVTDDNPRSEAPAAIRAEILAGATGAREIGDRAEAIAAAVGMMGPGDVVLVAGKGHETGQIVGDKVLPFSDHEFLQTALERAR